MLIVSYLARCLSSVLLMVVPDVSLFVLLVSIKGLANLGAAPAEQVITRSMLSKTQLVSNAGIMTTIDQLTKLCAPLLGAGMAGLHHPAAGFGSSASLAVAGILCAARLRKPVEMSRRHARRPGLAVSAFTDRAPGPLVIYRRAACPRCRSACARRIFACASEMTCLLPTARSRGRRAW
ncbi:hypothetical protein LMG9673_02614 [Ralstonia pseudosolanacearum]|nr:hypothetical protein LMG9673_02614 [Ralstonia pseudosolanacearum]